MLMGSYASEEKSREWVWFDGIGATGATLKNGSFENLDGNGTPRDWVVNDKVDIGGNAQDNSVAVKVNHDHRTFQNIEVKAGIPVTVICVVKSAR